MQRIVLYSTLTAACLGLQLIPRVPNVEFTSLITFIVGIVFGGYMGALLGGIVMFVNGFLSPWGFAGLMMPFQMAGMAVVGVVGGFYAKMMRNTEPKRLHLETAILGAFLTLLYDIVTNVGVAVSFVLSGTPIIYALIGALISGAVMSLIHVSSNTALFGVATIPLVNAIKKLLGE